MIDHRSSPPPSILGRSSGRGPAGQSADARTVHHFQRLCEEAAEVWMSLAGIEAAIPTHHAIARLFAANEMVVFWQRQLRLERERADSIPSPGCPFAYGDDEDG